ncbi:MAG: ABC transporter permease [Planctomycetota bacterium]|nr:ABC transporter permease [Planctomycetota bacterium]
MPPERGVEGPWRVFREQFRKNHLALAGVTIVVLLSAVALLCPLLAPHHPLEMGDILDDGLRPPSYEHPLGTDRLARDVLSRIVYGSRVSMVVGLLSMAIAVGIGTAYGAVAGYFGGWIDGLLMRLVDVFLAFPSIILIITVVHLWDDQSLWVIAVIIGTLSWMRIARLVRGQFLKLKETEFFLAARSLGAGAGRLILRHLLPNALTPIIVASTLGIGNTILVEASLSYLGLGVQQPTPSWGNIVSDNASAGQWGIAFLSGTAIVITVVGYNLLGDGLRDALDPRERR